MAEVNDITRLMDKLEEMGKSIARIEEQVKPIADIKKDVDDLRLTVSEAMASTKSAHKRLDDFEDDFKTTPTRAEYNSLNERVIKIEKIVNWVGLAIVGAVIAAILSLVLTQP